MFGYGWREGLRLGVRPQCPWGEWDVVVNTAYVARGRSVVRRARLERFDALVRVKLGPYQCAAGVFGMYGPWVPVRVCMRVCARASCMCNGSWRGLGCFFSKVRGNGGVASD